MKSVNCSILIVNPLDEYPTRELISGVIIKYQHGRVNVGGLSFSRESDLRLAKDI